MADYAAATARALGERVGSRSNGPCTRASGVHGRQWVHHVACRGVADLSGYVSPLRLCGEPRQLRRDPGGYRGHAASSSAGVGRTKSPSTTYRVGRPAVRETDSRYSTTSEKRVSLDDRGSVCELSLIHP